MSHDDALDARQAAELLQHTADHARGRLTVNYAPIYGAWGMAWLIGCGAVWLSVRAQHPFHDPAAWATAILAAGTSLAATATAATVSRAARGIGGVWARQARMFALSWPAGFGTLFAITGAADHLGAGPTVTALLGVAGAPMLVGLIYMLAAGMWLDRVMFWLGAWELLVAAAGAWTGLAGMLLADAVAGGGGFLAAAALLALRKRA
jgi:hypothetical protein